MRRRFQKVAALFRMFENQTSLFWLFRGEIRSQMTVMTQMKTETKVLVKQVTKSVIRIITTLTSAKVKVSALRKKIVKISVTAIQKQTELTAEMEKVKISQEATGFLTEIQNGLSEVAGDGEGTTSSSSGSGSESDSEPLSAETSAFFLEIDTVMAECRKLKTTGFVSIKKVTKLYKRVAHYFYVLRMNIRLRLKIRVPVRMRITVLRKTIKVVKSEGARLKKRMRTIAGGLVQGKISLPKRRARARRVKSVMTVQLQTRIKKMYVHSRRLRKSAGYMKGLKDTLQMLYSSASEDGSGVSISRQSDDASIFIRSVDNLLAMIRKLVSLRSISWTKIARLYKLIIRYRITFQEDTKLLWQFKSQILMRMSIADETRNETVAAVFDVEKGVFNMSREFTRDKVSLPSRPSPPAEILSPKKLQEQVKVDYLQKRHRTLMETADYLGSFKQVLMSLTNMTRSGMRQRRRHTRRDWIVQLNFMKRTDRFLLIFARITQRRTRYSITRLRIARRRFMTWFSRIRIHRHIVIKIRKQIIIRMRKISRLELTVTNRIGEIVTDTKGAKGKLLTDGTWLPKQPKSYKTVRSVGKEEKRQALLTLQKKVHILSVTHTQLAQIKTFYARILQGNLSFSTQKPKDNLKQHRRERNPKHLAFKFLRIFDLYMITMRKLNSTSISQKYINKLYRNMIKSSEVFTHRAELVTTMRSHLLERYDPGDASNQLDVMIESHTTVMESLRVMILNQTGDLINDDISIPEGKKVSAVVISVVQIQTQQETQKLRQRGGVLRETSSILSGVKQLLEMFHNKSSQSQGASTPAKPGMSKGKRKEKRKMSHAALAFIRNVDKIAALARRITAEGKVNMKVLRGLFFKVSQFISVSKVSIQFLHVIRVKISARIRLITGEMQKTGKALFSVQQSIQETTSVLIEGDISVPRAPKPPKHVASAESVDRQAGVKLLYIVKHSLQVGVEILGRVEGLLEMLKNESESSAATTPVSDPDGEDDEEKESHSDVAYTLLHNIDSCVTKVKRLTAGEKVSTRRIQVLYRKASNVLRYRHDRRFFMRIIIRIKTEISVRLQITRRLKVETAGKFSNVTKKIQDETLTLIKGGVDVPKEPKPPREIVSAVIMQQQIHVHTLQVRISRLSAVASMIEEVTSFLQRGANASVETATPGSGVTVTPPTSGKKMDSVRFMLTLDRFIGIAQGIISKGQSIRKDVLSRFKRLYSRIILNFYSISIIKISIHISVRIETCMQLANSTMSQITIAEEALQNATEPLLEAEVDVPEPPTPPVSSSAKELLQEKDAKLLRIRVKVLHKVSIMCQRIIRIMGDLTGRGNGTTQQARPTPKSKKKGHVTWKQRRFVSSLDMFLLITKRVVTKKMEIRLKKVKRTHDMMMKYAEVAKHGADIYDLISDRLNMTRERLEEIEEEVLNTEEQMSNTTSEYISAADISEDDDEEEEVTVSLKFQSALQIKYTISGIHEILSQIEGLTDGFQMLVNRTDTKETSSSPVTSDYKPKNHSARDIHLEIITFFLSVDFYFQQCDLFSSGGEVRIHLIQSLYMQLSRSLFAFQESIGEVVEFKHLLEAKIHFSTQRLQRYTDTVDRLEDQFAEMNEELAESGEVIPDTTLEPTLAPETIYMQNKVLKMAEKKCDLMHIKHTLEVFKYTFQKATNESATTTSRKPMEPQETHKGFQLRIKFTITTISYFRILDEFLSGKFSVFVKIERLERLIFDTLRHLWKHLGTMKLESVMKARINYTMVRLQRVKDEISMIQRKIGSITEQLLENDIDIPAFPCRPPSYLSADDLQKQHMFADTHQYWQHLEISIKVMRWMTTLVHSLTGNGTASSMTPPTSSSMAVASGNASNTSQGLSEMSEFLLKYDRLLLKFGKTVFKGKHLQVAKIINIYLSMTTVISFGAQYPDLIMEGKMKLMARVNETRKLINLAEDMLFKLEIKITQMSGNLSEDGIPLVSREESNDEEEYEEEGKKVSVEDLEQEVDSDNDDDEHEENDDGDNDDEHEENDDDDNDDEHEENDDDDNGDDDNDDDDNDDDDNDDEHKENDDYDNDDDDNDDEHEENDDDDNNDGEDDDEHEENDYDDDDEDEENGDSDDAETDDHALSGEPEGDDEYGVEEEAFSERVRNGRSKPGSYGDSSYDRLRGERSVLRKSPGRQTQGRDRRMDGRKEWHESEMILNIVTDEESYSDTFSLTIVQLHTAYHLSIQKQRLQDLETCSHILKELDQNETDKGHSTPATPITPSETFILPTLGTPPSQLAIPHITACPNGTTKVYELILKLETLFLCTENLVQKKISQMNKIISTFWSLAKYGPLSCYMEGAMKETLQAVLSKMSSLRRQVEDKVSGLSTDIMETTFQYAKGGIPFFPDPRPRPWRPDFDKIVPMERLESTITRSRLLRLILEILKKILDFLTNLLDMPSSSEAPDGPVSPDPPVNTSCWTGYIGSLLQITQKVLHGKHAHVKKIKKVYVAVAEYLVKLANDSSALLEAKGGLLDKITVFRRTITEVKESLVYIDKYILHGSSSSVKEGISVDIHTSFKSRYEVHSREVLSISDLYEAKMFQTLQWKFSRLVHAGGISEQFLNFLEKSAPAVTPTSAMSEQNSSEADNCTMSKDCFYKALETILNNTDDKRTTMGASHEWIVHYFSTQNVSDLQENISMIVDDLKESSNLTHTGLGSLFSDIQLQSEKMLAKGIPFLHAPTLKYPSEPLKVMNSHLKVKRLDTLWHVLRATQRFLLRVEDYGSNFTQGLDLSCDYMSSNMTAECKKPANVTAGNMTKVTGMGSMSAGMSGGATGSMSAGMSGGATGNMTGDIFGNMSLSTVPSDFMGNTTSGNATDRRPKHRCARDNVHIGKAEELLQALHELFDILATSSNCSVMIDTTWLSSLQSSLREAEQHAEVYLQIVHCSLRKYHKKFSEWKMLATKWLMQTEADIDLASWLYVTGIIEYYEHHGNASLPILY